MADTDTMPIVDSLPQETVEFAHRMFNAARENNSELLLQAIDAGLPVNLSNDQGGTFVMLAAYNGHDTLVKELLDRGADANRANIKGQTCVAGAVFKGYKEVVRILLEAGADPRSGTPNAIETAQMFKRDDLLELLGATDADLAKPLPIFVHS